MKTTPLTPCRSTQSRLATAFLAHARELPRYSQRVDDECCHFPEGDLFPFVFPALGLLSLAQDGRVPMHEAHEASCALLDEARSAVVRRLGEIALLREGVRESVYLAWLALGFSVHQDTTGDKRYEEQRRHVCEVLLAELDARKGLPLDSFPGKVWPFDTIPALVALTLSDRLDGHTHSRAAVRRHLAWIGASGSDPVSGLPWSNVDPEGRRAPEPPRGCDLSLRVGLLRMIDPAAAETLYRRYARAYWHEMGALAGFREWPRGHAGGVDADSGPLIAGLGMAASGFGIGAAAVMGDRWRTARLCGQFHVITGLIRLAMRVWPLLPRRARASYLDELMDPSAATGFLFGDACLFLTLTWSSAQR